MNQHRSMTRREVLLAAANTVGVAAMSTFARAREDAATRTIPAVPGRLQVPWRRREKHGDGLRVVEETVEWQASETAVIVCDMWAEHPCKLAEARVAQMAPRMNEILSLARDHGVAIIHAPSSSMKHYDGTAFRERMKSARRSDPPVPIQRWCYLNPKQESPLPIVDDVVRADGAVSGCDDPNPIAHPNHDRHEHPAIKTIGYDGVSDDGQEIFNFLEQEGRKNVVLMGVHTNMCVLGRPFGIRQQKYLGKNVVLCRDLTDALYDPRDKPFVSHARGVELVIEHIETYWCPSILGEALARVIPGSAGPLSAERS